MKNLLGKYSDMETLSKGVYEPQAVDTYMKDKDKNEILNYKVLAVKDDLATGYYAVVVRNEITNEVTLVNRGTEITDLDDLHSDVQMVQSKIQAQLGVASKFFDEFNFTNPSSKITNLTGHSLGDSDSKLLAILKNVNAIGFNGYGVKSILNELPNTIESLRNSINDQRNNLQELMPNTEMNLSLKQQLYDSLARANNHDLELEIMKKIVFVDKYLATTDSLKLAQDLSNAYSDYLKSPTDYSLISINAVDDKLVSNNPFNKDGHIGTIIDVKHNDGVISGISIAGIDLSLYGVGTILELINAHSINNMDESKITFLLNNIKSGGSIPQSILPNFTPTQYDPIILDLDGDGIETVGLGAGVLFDHNADGIKTGTGWVGKDDGLLVLDKNKNGVIDNGMELFGDNTLLRNGQKAKDGFAAISDLDLNQDGKLNSNDAAFSSLRIWQDINQDGISQANELKSLSSLGISSINTNVSITGGQSQNNGNVVIGSSTFEHANGSISTSGALNFTGNTFTREFSDTIDTSSVAGLPDVLASGTVRDLREAAALSSDLSTKLQFYVENNVRSGVGLDDLLNSWAATSNMNTLASTLKPGAHPADGRGTNLNQAEINKLNILEKFTGMYSAIPNFVDPMDSYDGTVNGRYSGTYYGINLNADAINKSYSLLSQRVREAIAVQTYLKDDISQIRYNFSKDGVDLDISSLYNGINLENAARKIGDTLSIVDYFKQNTNLVSAENYAEVVNWVKIQLLDKKVDLSNYYLGGFVQVGNKDGDFIITSSAGNSVNSTTISAGDGNNFIFGLAGNDNITGGVDSDFIRGGSGNDTIYDNGGSNTIFADDGNDLVWAGGDADYIEGGNGDDKLAGGWGADIINGGDGNDTIYGGNLQGKIVGIDNGNILSGGNGDDIIYGEFQDDKLYGDAGNDMLYGSYGNDFMDGGSGNDYLGDGFGNNTFIGGAGNDTLKGGTGNDSYIFNIGEGRDIVIDAGGIDTIVCGSGITPQNINFIKDGNNLLFCVNGDTLNSTVIQDWYLTSGQQIEQFRFADGTTIATNSLIAQNGVGSIVTGTVANDTSSGGSFADILRGLAGNDILSGLSGNDTLVGGVGSDYLNGGLGNDRYQFVVGDGADIIEDTGGNDFIELSGDIKQEDLEFDQIDNDLILRNKKSSDQITIKNWAISTENQIEHLVLNETSLSLLQLVEDFNRVKIGTNGDDNLILDKKVIEVNAKAGNDVIVDQTLNNTNYIFNLGDGRDSIYDKDSSVDQISFGAGITLEQLQFTQSGRDLVVNITGQDQITIKDYALQSNRIETMSFNTGEKINLAEILYQRGILTDATSLKLGNGNDTIWSSHGGTYALKDGDNQLIISDSGQSNNITSGIGNDSVIIFGDSNNKLSLGAGNNIVELQNGNNTITTGIGNDVIFTLDGDNVIRAGDGDNLINLGSGIQNIATGSGNDIIQINSGNITLNSGAGDDHVMILNLQDSQQASINLGDGNDELHVTGTGGLVKVSASTGDDVVEIVGVNAQISDSGGNNIINVDNHGLAAAASNTLRLGANNDTVNLISDGTSSLSLGQGENQLKIIGNGTNSVSAGTDNDSVTILGDSNNKINLGAGNNKIDIRGNSINNILTGAGDDVINLESNENIIRAGDGNNLIKVVSTGVQNIVTGSGNDIIELSSGNVTLNSGAGNDNIILKQTTASTNSINLGDGDDSLNINSAGGATTINGSTGNDTFMVQNSSVKLIDNGGDNIVHIDNSAMIGDVNSISLGFGNDKITMISNGQNLIKTSNGDNSINLSGFGTFNVTAGTGADTIISGSGNDVINSGAGNDTINANAGDDRIIAGSGNDLLIGGLGNDILEGGADDDSYYFNSGDGKDVIKDSGGVDQVIFGDGVLKEDLWFMRSGKDLLVSNTKTQDEVKVTNWFGSKNNQIENFNLASGEVLSGQAVASLVQVMASFNPQPMAETSMTSSQQSQYQDMLKNTWIVDPTK